jgi:6-phosphogluconolactonase
MLTNRTVIVVNDPDELAVKGADLFRQAARDSVHRNGRFCVAVSGGTTPRGMHRRLSRPPYLKEVPWSGVHLFWVDERLVPADDPASNYGTARRDLLEKVPLPPAQIHPMVSDAPPETAAESYSATLTASLRAGPDTLPAFDLIVLGLGTDGHTASIFPGDATAVRTDRRVVAVKGGNPDVERLTLSLPVLNRARRTVFLASGRNKAAVIHRIFTDPQSGDPATLIQPVAGTLCWLLDRDAAALLPPGAAGL